MRREARELRKAALLELESIASGNGGIFPAAVVERARDESSALHSYFDWDNETAGEAFRLMQARVLIRSYTVAVKVSGSSEPQKVRAFVSLTTDRRERLGYRAMVDVVDNADQYEQLLRDALAELQTFRRKYARLSEIEAVLEAIDAVVRKVQRKGDGDQDARAAV